MDVLDRASETFALDVVSVIEATLEDPRQILAAQLKKARGEAIAAMMADGIEYDERMELLDEVTYPRPLDELLGHAFEVYLRSNPWAADAQLSPKSVVREMWERVVGRPTLFPVLQPLDGREDRQRRGIDDHGYCGTAQADAQTGAVDRVEPAAAP